MQDNLQVITALLGSLHLFTKLPTQLTSLQKTIHTCHVTIQVLFQHSLPRVIVQSTEWLVYQCCHFSVLSVSSVWSHSWSVSKWTSQTTFIMKATLSSYNTLCYKGISLLPTHVLSTSSADFGTSDESVTVAIPTMSATSSNTLRTTQWTPDSLISRTCHLNTTSRKFASALSPTFPVGDHSASKTKTT